MGLISHANQATRGRDTHVAWALKSPKHLNTHTKALTSWPLRKAVWKKSSRLKIGRTWQPQVRNVKPQITEASREPALPGEPFSVASPSLRLGVTPPSLLCQGPCSLLCWRKWTGSPLNSRKQTDSAQSQVTASYKCGPFHPFEHERSKFINLEVWGSSLPAPNPAVTEGEVVVLLGYFCCPAGEPNARLVTAAADNCSLERRARADEDARTSWGRGVSTADWKTPQQRRYSCTQSRKRDTHPQLKERLPHARWQSPYRAGPCWQKAAWGGGWGSVPGRPELALQGSPAWFQLYLSWLLTHKSEEAPPAPSGMSLWGRPGAELFPFLPSTSHPPSPLSSPLLGC